MKETPLNGNFAKGKSLEISRLRIKQTQNPVDFGKTVFI
jgi:hypothetical protein